MLKEGSIVKIKERYWSTSFIGTGVIRGYSYDKTPYSPNLNYIVETNCKINSNHDYSCCVLPESLVVPINEIGSLAYFINNFARPVRVDSGIIEDVEGDDVVINIAGAGYSISIDSEYVFGDIESANKRAKEINESL